MTNLELALSMLAEDTSTEFSKAKNPNGLNESKDIVKRGGGVAGEARENIENQLSHTILSKKNAKNPKLLDE
ncbi:MAG: hypothetical protein LBV42_04045 [Methanobrevibacter sp.]|jgi:hypothetical protein|nr:hypothetical protein [Methanobrevibacter sp.]